MAGYGPNAQTRFDGLYRFFRDHPSDQDPDLMAWRQLGNCAEQQRSQSASDGDLNIAFGLLLAHTQWGSDGPINYRAEALKVLAAIRQHVIHPTSKLARWATGSIPPSRWSTRRSGCPT